MRMITADDLATAAAQAPHKPKLRCRIDLEAVRRLCQVLRRMECKGANLIPIACALDQTAALQRQRGAGLGSNLFSQRGRQQQCLHWIRATK